jgi:chemotaxis protein CheD
MAGNMIIVGMADLNVCKTPMALTTLGLGSCIGIALYDASTKTAGLAHIMLPDSTQIQNNSNVAKFADTAMKKLIDDMVRLGARREQLKAKIAGGAQMFDTPGAHSGGDSGVWQIGTRNVNAVVETLQKLRIPIIAKDVLKNYGRTVTFDPVTGIMVVRALNKQILEL